MTDVAQVPEHLRKDFLRDGALNAMWQAHGFHRGLTAIEAALEEKPDLPPEKLTVRMQFLALTRSFLEIELTRQMRRALVELTAWAEQKEE